MTLKTFAPLAAALLGAGAAQAAIVPHFLFADQGADEIRLTRDLNGDGDANDPGETKRFFGAGDAGGLGATGNVFTLTQARDGAVYFGDGATDAVYRLRDKDGNGDAQGAGEAAPWFSAAGNAGGFQLHTPNGVAQGADGAIYVVEADVRSDQSGDVVYRTIDLNGDGDAEDEGEASVWLDLKALNPNASAFEISFDGDIAYIADTRGGDENVIYRAQDRNGDGTVSADEVREFIRGDNSFGVPVDFAMDAGDGQVFLWEFLDFNGPTSLFGLRDLDGSGAIGAGEWAELWNSNLLPDNLEVFATFAMAYGADGSILLTSNAGDAAGDNLIRLVDLNGDGDFKDPGETAAWLGRSINGLYPERARAATWYVPTAATPVPLPASALLLSGALGLLRLRRRG